LFTNFVGYVSAENQEPQLQWKVEGPIDWQPRFTFHPSFHSWCYVIAFMYEIHLTFEICMFTRLQGWPWPLCFPQVEICWHWIVAGNVSIMFALHLLHLSLLDPNSD
jgi:hypothetical protein